MTEGRRTQIGSVALVLIIGLADGFSDGLLIAWAILHGAGGVMDALARPRGEG